MGLSKQHCVLTVALGISALSGCASKSSVRSVTSDLDGGGTNCCSSERLQTSITSDGSLETGNQDGGPDSSETAMSGTGTSEYQGTTGDGTRITAVESGGSPTEAGSSGNSTVSPCATQSVARFADWPMPNPASLELPNPAAYQVGTGVVSDEVTGLVWQEPAAEGAFGWAAAMSYCETLELNGWRNWRLPSRIELVSLVDYTEYDPALDSGAFSPTSALFWTSSQREQNGAVAYWWVRFRAGDTGTSLADSERENAVRCVRTERCAAAPEPRFVVDGGAVESEQVVSDRGTGLQWQRLATGNTLYNHAAAINYCSELPLDGGGFRLPSVKELQTIEDETRLVEGAQEGDVFLGIPESSRYWTASMAADSAGRAWTVNPGGEAAPDRVSGNDLSDRNAVRCVR